MSFHSGFLSCRRILLMLKIKGVMMAGDMGARKEEVLLGSDRWRWLLGKD